MTGVNADRVTDLSEEVILHYDSLNTMIDHLDEKMQKMIDDHSKQYSIAYKNRMFEIKMEMENLKNKASEATLKAKKEKRLQDLEKERNWFRKEALKLDKMNRDRKWIMQKMKTNLENVSEDKHFFQQ